MVGKLAVVCLQIVAGAHNVGDLGVVAHSEGGVVEVLLDSTDSTVHVLVNNLVETTQERSTIEALGRYRTNDLVRLRDDTVGMIIRLSAATAHLLIPGEDFAKLPDRSGGLGQSSCPTARSLTSPPRCATSLKAQRLLLRTVGPLIVLATGYVFSSF